MKKKIISLLLSSALLLTTLLTFTLAGVSASAETYTADPTWYDANKSVLEINDIPDFVAFMNKLDELGTTNNGSETGAEGNLAAISWKNGVVPFEGQTIVLNTDINLNPGIIFSSEGPSDSSAFRFNRTERQIGFGGIFDGQGHTISGLYINAAKGAAGSIFGVAGAVRERTNVVVRNLQVRNSFITNANMGVATIFSSVPFNCTAVIQNVYSDAFVCCTSTGTGTDSKLKASITGVNMGGLCATVGGTLTIDSSVYEGTFSTASGGGYKKYVGGLVGNITNKTLNDDIWYTAKLNVENSAYYGTYEGNGVYLGKISGTQTAGAIVTVNNSIFLGKMNSTKSLTPGSGATKQASTYYVGRLIGDATSQFTLTGKGNVASPSIRVGTNVTANYNTGVTSGFTANISVTAKANSELTGAVNLNSVLNGLGRYWVANGTKGGCPVPSSFMLLFGEEALKHNYVSPLPVTTYDLLEQLGTKLENGGVYTEDSYRRYSDAYASIIGKIFAAGADLTAINIASLKAQAEAKLLTPIQARRIELIAELGAKISNASGIYTADSYGLYSTSYDSVINKINNTATISELDAIDVAALREAAEAKLVEAITVKRAELIAALGEKLENDGSYTEESYAAYSKAYDDALASINGALTATELESINVPTLKSEAEGCLVTVIDSKKSELIESLGDKISNDGSYLDSSYSEYSNLYDELVDKINRAESLDELNEIDVDTFKTEAEEILSEVDPNTLEGRKLLALKALGKKLDNSDGRYTEDSYAEYLKAYDAAVEIINNATDMLLFDLIDVETLKIKAEGNLVLVDAPAESEPPKETNDGPSDEPSTESTDTDATDTDATADANVSTEAPTSEATDGTAGGGCRSSAGITSLAVIALISAAGVTLRKKD